MPTVPEDTLEVIIKSAHTPAVSYAYVESTAPERGITAAVGRKNAESSDAEAGIVDASTQFPASSLSKIVFAYLVLKLAKEGHIDLDEPLHDILPYERFLVDGEYPKKAQELTARHVLSHTTGLPNLGSNLSSSPLTFDPASELGEGYSYSGEALLYLQKVIESKMGKDLETLAKEHVFGPLGMKRSSFLPAPASNTNVVTVHTELGKPTPTYVCDPPLNAAGSLLTTGEDFSKFMAAWLDNMDDPILRQAFNPVSADDFPTCGLGWHLYKNTDTGGLIAYQFGENPNTRAFVAINLTEKKGAVFFTNSENGMSIASQIFSSPELAPVGDLQVLYKHLHYTQSDEPGWQETISGKIAEVDGNVEDARHHFEKSVKLAPENDAIKRRLEWFNKVHHPSRETEFTLPLDALIGEYKNPYNDKVSISIKDGGLVYKELGREIKLIRVSETEYLPEKDQSFKISFDGGQMSIHSIQGWEKSLTKESQELEQSLPPTSLTRIESASLVAESEDPALPVDSSVESIPDPKNVDLGEWVRKLENCPAAKSITYTISMDAVDAAQLKHIESIGKILELKGYIFKITPSADVTDTRALAEAPPMTALTGLPRDKPSSTDEETAGDACQP